MVLALGGLAAMVAQDASRAQSVNSKLNASESQYAVLSPWAEVDPVPLRVISPRLGTLAGKKIGLFANFKRAARPMAAALERRLKERFPDCQTSLFDSTGINVAETETENRVKFEAWAKGVDAAIAMVGD
jgi:hypothetical protein